MLKMYGHDTRPFLEEAWNVIGASKSRASASRDEQAAKKIGNSKPSNPKQTGPISFLGNAVMLVLNAIACLALFSAWRSGLPYPFYTKFTWLCFAAFGFTALWRMKDGAVILCLPLACLFNPFYPIHLTRSVWSVIDVISILLLVAISFSLLANPKK